MDGYEVKKVMDQVHISPKMQEEVIMNIQKRLEHGNKNTGAWNWRRTATAAAAFILAVGVVSAGVRSKCGTGENGERSRRGNERS